MDPLRIVVYVMAFTIAAPSSGAELSGSVKVGGDWIGVSRSDESDESAFLVRPGVRLKSDASILAYDVSYQPIWRYFRDDRRDNEWNHDLKASSTWNPSSKTTLTVTDRYIRTSSVALFNDIVGTEDTAQTTDDQVRLAQDRGTVQNNSFGATFQHRLSSATFLGVALSHNWFQEDIRTTTAFSGSVSLNRNLTGRSSVGTSFEVSRNTSQLLDTEERGTNYVGLNGLWSYTFDPTMSLSLAAGPRLVLQDSLPDPPSVFPDFPRFPLRADGEGGLLPLDVASCPTLPDGTHFLDESCAGLPPPLSDAIAAQIPSFTVDLPVVGEVPESDDQNVTYFANMSLTKRWETVTGTLGYRRSAATTSSLGTSTIDDIVNGSLFWQPDQKWNLFLSASYRHSSRATTRLAPVQLVRQSSLGIAIPARTAGERFGIGFVEVDDDLETDSVFVRLRVGYKVNDRISLEASGFYDYGGTGDLRDRGAHFVRVSFGVLYSFRPVYL